MADEKHCLTACDHSINVSRAVPINSGGFVDDFAGVGEVEDAGLYEGLDGFLDEVWSDLVFEGGVDSVFERPAGGGAGFRGIGEFDAEKREPLFRCPQGGDFREGFATGDEFLLSLEITNHRIEVGVLRDDVEVAVRIGGENSSEFECQDEVEGISPLDRGLNDSQLFGMLLDEEEEGDGQGLLLGSEDHEDLGGFSNHPREIGFADVFTVDEDVLGAGQGVGPRGNFRWG